MFALGGNHPVKACRWLREIATPWNKVSVQQPIHKKMKGKNASTRFDRLTLHWCRDSESFNPGKRLPTPRLACNANVCVGAQDMYNCVVIIGHWT